MAVVQEFNLNVVPDSAPVIVHVDQFDTGEGRLKANLYNGDTPYSPVGASAMIQGTKPDGTFYMYSAEISGNVVTANLEKVMTQVPGRVRTQFVITDSENRTGTFVFWLEVQATALQTGGDSESIIEYIEEAIEQAQEYTEESEAWALGTRSGTDVPSTDPAYHNNSKYYAGEAATSESNAAASESNASASEQAAAASEENAEAWAAGKRDGSDVPSTDPTYHNNSKYYAGEAATSESNASVSEQAAAASEENAEAWAAGKRDGSDVPSTDPTYHNNSKYYAGEAATSESNASASEQAAAASEENAEAWAVGKRDGSDVPSTDPTYHNNSKYYAGEASTSATNASNSESAAEDSAEDAEAWAAGTRGGTPVPPTDPAYHNNSKYWSDKSAAQTLNGLSDVDIDNPSDGESLVYDAQANKWTNKAATSHFITKPTVSDFSFTYNGSAQGPTITGLDPDFANYVTTTGATNTDAGTYTLRFSIKNTQVNLWKDLTTQDITYEYTIAKAAGDVTLSKNKVELDADHLTGTVDISDATGSVTITSSDTNIATVSPAVLTQDGTVTISSVNDKSGTTTVTVSVAASANYLATSKTIEVKASFVAIYGAEWDGTSTTAWSRTDDSALFTDPVPQHADGNGGWTQGSSPFDTLQPWAGMTKINHASAGVVVKIPKFWYKITQSGAGLKIQIADGEVDGFSVSPAHMDRGDGEGERDEVMVGRYHCCNTDYKSATGDTPKVNVTRPAARSGIHNLGSDIWQMDFATRFTLWLLYIVEFADWNSQAKIGGGCAPAGSTSAVRNMGYTDGMTYHTGTDQTTIGAEVYGGTQYRNIEGLWDNCYDWLDGCYNNANGLNLILDPSSFSDDTGGTSVGIPSNGWPAAFTKKEVSGTFPMFIASATGGSGATYSCDSWYFGASGPCVYAGGNYGQGQILGLFCLNYTSVSGSSANRGCRLLVLP